MTRFALPTAGSVFPSGVNNTSILSAPADVVALDASVTDPAVIVNVTNFYQNVNPNRFRSVSKATRVQNSVDSGPLCSARDRVATPPAPA